MAIPSKEAQSIRVARGFSSFKDWKKQNRAARAEFVTRKNKETNAEKDRLDSLIRRLDADYDKYIAPNL
jgi:hypothetical protein